MLRSLRVPQEDIRRLQLDRLRSTVETASTRHPFYGSVLGDVNALSFQSVGDIDRVPLTTKSDLAEDPERFRVLSKSGKPHDTWDVVFTSGTTAEPTPIYQTRYDYDRILFAQRRMASIRGIRSSDTIANLFPLARLPNGSWMRVNDHAIAVGARLVVGFGGPASGELGPTRRLPEVVKTVTEAQPTVLWGVGSYLRRFLGECLRQKRSLPKVRMVVTSGEALSEDVKTEMFELLGSMGAARAVHSPGFGASELQCSLVQCSGFGGFHNPCPELFLLQVVDDAAETLPYGSTGHLVLTHLDRRGTLLIRYALGDVVTLEEGACDGCGRSGERIVSHHGRADTLVKVRGQLIDLAALSQLISDDPDVDRHTLTIQPPIATDPASMDELLVRVVATPGAAVTKLETRLSRAIVDRTSVTPTMEITGYGHSTDHVSGA